jgi:3-oxoacyl-[acyl-carrier-protein] synthase II
VAPILWAPRAPECLQAMTNRIAITGIGVIAPGGAIGLDAFSTMLREGRSGIVPIDRFDTASARSRLGGMITGFKVRDFIPMMKARRMNNLSRMGLASAKLAIEAADLGSQGFAKTDVGVAMGTAFGPVQTSVDYMREYLAKGPALAPPQLFAESVANAPGSHVAIEHDFEGFNVTFTQREGSFLTALMYASQQMMKGVTRAAVCVGVDELNDVLFGVLDRVGALAHEKDGRDEAMRPLDARRNGIVLGEGSASLVLLNEDDCRSEPRAWVSGFGIARDPTASISDWGTEPEAGVAAMRQAVEDAGLSISDIDAVFASANGSVRGDRVEMIAIEELFGNETPVTAVKGCFGEYAAAGALQLVAAVVSLGDQCLPRSVGFDEPESGCGLRVVSERTPAALHHVIVNAFSAGGGIVSAVLSRSGT